MGFPSPAKDYIEPRLDLNEIFILHPAATTLVQYDGITYIVDAALTPRDGDTLCYEIFGEQGIGKLMGGCIVTPDGECIEGEVLNDVVVMGKVTTAITPLYDCGRPTI
ncbi:phage repressor protein [Erwinia persicina]|uniref:hypothetical protein n=1 Tax=Erwinia persicina TaxID=55211 RepID=UPI0007895BB7|nr:hypothetical protein [Erwinia persicina]MCQ4105140.1 phage repressor protein [Erwinia persicina]UTX11356.1 phage repressor protein [Erwinia persicina]